MSFDVRAVASREEYDAAVLGIGQYFGMPALSDERYERFLRVLPHDRMFAAFEDGSIVGGAGSFAFQLSVPGGARVPCAGVSVVGVYPTHRRRGILGAMMRAQLDDVHARGEPIAALWASEEAIYGRYGYGMGSWAGEIGLAREYTDFALPFERRGRMRLVDGYEAREHMPRIWERLMDERPGMFQRPEPWWTDRVLADPEDRREPGAGPKRFVLCELDGDVRGYAIYRHKASWGEGVATGKLTVLEAIAVDPDATRELWRFLLDIDWFATIEAWLLPPDHPLFLLLASPRRARYRMGDGLWVRLVDVAAALSSRSYAAGGPIVFEVADPFCPWNEGRWKLEAGEASPTKEPPHLRLDAAALGSAFLGGITFRELADAHRVDEVLPDGLALADVLFHSPVHPWCPEIF
jgi:predicted acetyltransferase